MSYVSGFVAAVPTANKAAFIKHCEVSAVAMKKLGATQIVECWGEDVAEGKVTSFPMAVAKKPEETIVFSWVVWPSKAVCDNCVAKMMAGEVPELDPKQHPMPFDGKRMLVGGFDMVMAEPKGSPPLKANASYIVGGVAAVPTANKEAYIKYCHEVMSVVLTKLGANRLVECWGVDVPDGEVTSYKMATKQKADETVVFSWAEWPSKEVSHAANAKMMAGGVPEFDPKQNPMPFDGQRMFLGGFTPLLVA